MSYGQRFLYFSGGHLGGHLDMYWLWHSQTNVLSNAMRTFSVYQVLRHNLDI